MRKRTAVSVYVALVCVGAAGASLAAGLDDPAPFTLNIVAFMILATLTDLREIKLPWVGDRHALVRPGPRLPHHPRASGRRWPSPP